MSLHSPVVGDLPDHVRIGGVTVGPGEPTYVIAEAGSNHDRQLDKALELVDVAAASGCDAVKFQTFLGPDIGAGSACKEAQVPDEYRRWGSTLEDLYRACALPAEMHAPLAERAAEHGIAFLSSPFSEWAVDLLADLGVPAIKIASFELVHLPLIRHAASTGIPLILSTGMAGLGDVERALDAAAGGGAREVVLLHCGSSYPLGPSGANLRAMATMRQAFGAPVGFSDHTLGIAVPIAAAALGADAVEKHFTVSAGGDGPDHGFALRPDELAKLVAGVRDARTAVGSSMKRQQPEEADHARRGRRSVFAARDLHAGERVGPDDVKVLRPGVGLEPLALELVLGSLVRVDVREGEPLTWNHFLGD